MNLSSFQARLWKVDPSLRIRKRRGWMGYDRIPVNPAGLYRRGKYLRFRINNEDLQFYSRPFKAFEAVNKVTGQKVRKIIHRQARGRLKFVEIMVMDHDIHIGRAARQFLLL